MNIKDEIKKLNFFTILNDLQLDILSEISSIREYSENYILCYEQSKSEQLLFLVDGLAKVYKIDKHENEIFLHYIEKNSIISEITSIESDILSVNSNISFIENSKVLSVNYKQFKHFFLNKNILIKEFINEIIFKNERLELLINREFIHDAVTKVSIMLSSNLERFNKLKRHDIALMLHVQPSTLSRVLTKLKVKNIISITLGKVTIVDRNALELISKES